MIVGVAFVELLWTVTEYEFNFFNVFTLPLVVRLHEQLQEDDEAAIQYNRYVEQTEIVGVRTTYHAGSEI